MNMVIGVLEVLLSIGWLALIVYLITRAMNAPDYASRAHGWAFGLAAALLFAFPFGIAIGATLTAEEDPHANILCLRAHEEWRAYHHPAILAGKVFIPASTTTEKVWICEAWDNSTR